MAFIKLIDSNGEEFAANTSKINTVHVFRQEVSIVMDNGIKIKLASRYDKGGEVGENPYSYNRVLKWIAESEVKTD